MQEVVEPNAPDIARQKSIGRGPATFKRRDVTRALKATIAAGLDVQRIEIDRYGKITIVPGNATNDETENHEGRNEWDTVH